MNREEVVRLSRLAYSEKLTASDISALLIQYCVTEHNKPYNDTIMFVTALLDRPIELGFCVEVALRYYERKFVVFKLWSAPNPLSSVGQRKLLQIF